MAAIHCELLCISRVNSDRLPPLGESDEPRISSVPTCSCYLCATCGLLPPGPSVVCVWVRWQCHAASSGLTSLCSLCQVVPDGPSVSIVVPPAASGTPAMCRNSWDDSNSQVLKQPQEPESACESVAGCVSVTVFFLNFYSLRQIFIFWYFFYYWMVWNISIDFAYCCLLVHWLRDPCMARSPTYKYKKVFHESLPYFS